MEETGTRRGWGAPTPSMKPNGAPSRLRVAQSKALVSTAIEIASKVLRRSLCPTSDLALMGW
jgi:hypothetical protein